MFNTGLGCTLPIRLGVPPEITIITLQNSQPLLAIQESHKPLLNCMQDVAFEGWTRWSVVFHPTQKQATYYFNADFATPYTIEL